MGKWTEAIVSMATALVGVTIVAVLVSRRSATADVIKAAGSAYGDVLKVAVSPITN